MKLEAYSQSAASVTWSDDTEVEAGMATCGLYSYRLSTVGCSQRCKLWTVVEVLR